MANRRRKKEDPLENLLSLTILGGFFGGYYFTESWNIAIFASVLVIVLLLTGKYFIRHKRNEKLKKSGIHEIDLMDGFQFEYYLAQMFKSQGYKSTVTKARGDYGADLVLKSEGKIIVVQAKRYKGKVGLKAVQEIRTAVDHYNAHEAWVVSNADYTKQAIQLANSNNVKLINREDLIEMILKMNPLAVPSPEQTRNDIKAKTFKCSCGGDLILKKGKYGQFYGCTNYPSCNNIKNFK